MAVYASTMSAKGPFASSTPQSLPAHAPPPGTFLPGTKVQCGTHRVIIDRYLSEGGFAHVYVVRLPKPIDGNDKAVLKRVAVPDKDHLVSMRTEVETMKRLRGQKYIVKYIDSHASQLRGGGYEVFLLMEFCQGGGLIDFMNTRLQNRLTEPEILKIFTDIAEGVACMHYLKPPLLHRDLKVENVLISGSGSKKLFKLCDFGSAAPARPAATSAAEARLIEDDVQKHTTLQYRSPEMIDVYRKQPIDEKADIWALGVFLYKLCYYTTPFEEVGQMAILNAKFKYPGYPRFSDKMKMLIASMLREKPSDRPNIYQVLQKSCQLDGRELPVKDVYARRTQSEGHKDQVMPITPINVDSRVGATLAPPKEKTAATALPDIAPMRRGRPTKPVSHHGSAKPSPSPLRMIDPSGSDPFAALDGQKASAQDELSNKFPTLDEFSLMTDRGGKRFAFEPRSEGRAESADPQLADRVTQALADDAFARPPSPVKAKAIMQNPAQASKSTSVLERKRSTEIRGANPKASMPPPVAQKPAMVSTGTMTSRSSTPISATSVSNRAVWRVPSKEGEVKSATTGPVSRNTAPAPGEKSQSRLARLLQEDTANSQGIANEEPKSPGSSRPSLEGGRPSPRDMDLDLTRSRSLNIRNRPATVNMGSRPTHIKDREVRPQDYESNFVSAEPENSEENAVESDMNIQSDIDFLKAREEEEKHRFGEHRNRLGSGSRRRSSHGKRSSMPNIAPVISGTSHVISGTTRLISGRFGDAFKKFEGGHDHGRHHSRHHSASHDRMNALTPIAGSEATDLSDDRLDLAETEDLSPEMRRELEKRQLEAEERRVEQAAAEYRQRSAARGGGPGRGVDRASTIQNRVQSLIKENGRPAQKTATGYGRFTTEAPTPSMRKTVSNDLNDSTHPAVAPVSSSLPSQQEPQDPRLQGPTAPPKPQVLRTGQQGPASRLTPNDENVVSPEDWEAKFNSRYPSLSGLEMVEADLDSKQPTRTKMREV